MSSKTNIIGINALTTARNGIPGEASRGAAVKRAKHALGDALDRQLNLDIEQMEFALLARVSGISPATIRDRLDRATIEELEAWRTNLERLGEPDAHSATKVP